MGTIPRGTHRYASQSRCADLLPNNENLSEMTMPKTKRRKPYCVDETTRAPSPAALKLAAKLAEKLSPKLTAQPATTTIEGAPHHA
jgi:hypothetical protein